MSDARELDFAAQMELLPALPAIVHHILKVAESPDSSASDLAEVLMADQAVTAKVLRVANSPFYGSGREISELSRAVVRLGSVAIRNIVIAVCAKRTVSAIAGDVPEHAVLWRHGVAVAAAADLIARRIGMNNPEEAYVGGLLHDIGQLPMAVFRPQEFRTVFEAQGRGTRFLALERSYIGMDHTQAGYRLLSRWGLPTALCDVVRRHHEMSPGEGESQSDLVLVVMLADSLAQMIGLGFDIPVTDTGRSDAAARLLGLGQDDLVGIARQLENRVEEMSIMVGGLEFAPGLKAKHQAAIWIGPPDDAPVLGRLLLESAGFDLAMIEAGGFDPNRDQADLYIVALPSVKAIEAQRLAFGLAGVERQVLWLAPASEGYVRTVECHTESGRSGKVCHISRNFSAFDLDWALQEMGGRSFAGRRQAVLPTGDRIGDQAA